MKERFRVPFESEDHRIILGKLLQLFQSSRDRMTQRHPKWKQAEDLFRAYLPETTTRRLQQDARDRGSATQLSEVFIPYSYALALTAHTYATSVFLGRDPVWQYKGRHGETEQSTQCLEALMSYNQDIGDMAVPEFVWLLDTLKYGMGVIRSDYEKRVEIVSDFIEQPKTLDGVQVGNETEYVLVEEQVEGYCGNVLFNVRPYDFYPDPGVPLINFQEGAFAGHTSLMSLDKLKAMEKAWNLFNLKYLEPGFSNGDMAPSTMGSRDNMLAAEKVWNAKDLKDGKIGLFSVVVKVFPRDWHVPGQNYQKWQFIVANNSVVIQAQPLGLRHAKFPYDVIAYETEGYETSTRGMMEVTKPLNDVMNWLFNTHMFSVRRSLNGNVIADPMRVNIKDLLDGGPGRVVRLLPEAYGSDVRTAVTELMNVDPTRGHLSDTQFVEGLMQQMTGSNDPLMGQLGRGRKTATEIRSATVQGSSRMKTFCDYASAMGFTNLSRKMVCNLQQFYDGAKMFRIAGDLMQGTKFVNVDKSMITGEFDYVPVDGTLPIDRFAQATLWKEIFMVLPKVPQIAMQYDIGRIFAYMAQLAGLKNITQFKVTPDQAIMQQMQAGNIQPSSEGMNGSAAGYGGAGPSASLGAIANGIGIASGAAQ